MIQLDDVTLTYPDGAARITAINRASLTVRPGTVTAITGPSGSGKSSLLAVASTLITPDSGSVRIDGDLVSTADGRRSAELRRDRIGIVFQQSNLLPSLTVLDQLLVMAELAGPAGRRRRLEAGLTARRLLDAVGLDDQRGKRPHQLSGGQRQRVNIARSLMNQPRVLAVDEPTSALDRERGAEIIELILRLTLEQDTATLLVTHDSAHLTRMDRVLTMVDGVLS